MTEQVEREGMSITPFPESQPTKTDAGQAQRLRMSYDEYLARAEEDIHAEWVDGEVILQMPPKQPHQLVVVFLLPCLANSSSFSGWLPPPCPLCEARSA